MNAVATYFEVLQSKTSSCASFTYLLTLQSAEDRMVYVQKQGPTKPLWCLKGRFSRITQENKPYPLIQDSTGEYVISLAVVRIISRL